MGEPSGPGFSLWDGFNKTFPFLNGYKAIQIIYFLLWVSFNTFESFNEFVAIKKNEIMPFAATWMDLEIIILSSVSQKEKDKYNDIIYMWNLKYDTNKHTYKTKTDSQI